MTCALEASMALTYGEYLKLDELLNLQRPLTEGEHDETLFIVIHQVYELWFKQVLHEIGYLQARLEASDAAQAMATFKRVLTILKTMVSQIDVLETMTPLSFMSFRARLESSSGFQSTQFRRLEMVLGKRSKAILEQFPEESRKPGVYEAFLRYLKVCGYAVPDSALNRDFKEPLGENAELQKVLLDIYRTNPVLSQICERLVDLDEGIQEWRYRHVKMVERTIGMRMGTGGSAGADYLRRTLFQPLFPDLWAIRVQF